MCKDVFHSTCLRTSCWCVCWQAFPGALYDRPAWFSEDGSWTWTPLLAGDLRHPSSPVPPTGWWRLLCRPYRTHRKHMLHFIYIYTHCIIAHFVRKNFHFLFYLSFHQSLSWFSVCLLAAEQKSLKIDSDNIFRKFPQWVQETSD